MRCSKHRDRTFCAKAAAAALQNVSLRVVKVQTNAPGAVKAAVFTCFEELRGLEPQAV